MRTRFSWAAAAVLFFVWDVASGGRMGAVFGQDATEVAPPATTCTKQCQGQNQVRGQAVVLGFPSPYRRRAAFSRASRDGVRRASTP